MLSAHDALSQLHLLGTQDSTGWRTRGLAERYELFRHGVANTEHVCQRAYVLDAPVHLGSHGRVAPEQAYVHFGERN